MSFLSSKFTRRKALAGLASLVGGAAAGTAGLRALQRPDAAGAAERSAHEGHSDGAQSRATHGSAHAGFAGGGKVAPAVNGFDPSKILRDFDWGRTRRLAGGRVLREWDLVAVDKEIEVAPGVKFAAWTYNGRDRKSVV